MAHPNERMMTSEEVEALWKQQTNPDPITRQYKAMARANKYMGLCEKGETWIEDIHNFCKAHRITPNQLMDFYSENKKR